MVSRPAVDRFAAPVPVMPLGRRIAGGATLEIDAGPIANDRLRAIRALQCIAERRNKGDARWLMSETIAEADRASTLLVLQPDPTEVNPPLARDDLISWYGSFGFRVIQRKPIVLMARKANRGVLDAARTKALAAIDD